MLREEVGILVVDDVNTMRVQVRELLRGFGFKRIHLAENAEEAKRVLGVESVQLVLCDWQMGATSGLELLKHVRGDAKLKALGFVMVTAEGTKERVLEAVKLGVDDYLLKPLTMVQIQEKVYGVLVKKQVLK